jgi:hypothetical protein
MYAAVCVNIKKFVDTSVVERSANIRRDDLLTVQIKSANEVLIAKQRNVFTPGLRKGNEFSM